MGTPSDRQQLQQAVSLAKQGQKFEAINIVSEVLKNNQDNADAWILMAQLVDDQGRALECWRRAAQLRPDDQRIQANIARLEPGFSPYLDGTTDAAVQAVVPQVRRRTQSRGSGCFTMFLLSLIVVVLLGVLYGVYLNSTSPGWLGERIYDQQALDLIGKLHDTNQEVFDAMPDTSSVIAGFYEPLDSGLIVAADHYQQYSQNLIDLSTPVSRASAQPYMILAGQTCGSTPQNIQSYRERPTRQSMQRAVDAVSACSDALDVALGYLAVATEGD